MLISTALLLDSIIRNSVCTPAKLPCRRVEVGYALLLYAYSYNEIQILRKVKGIVALILDLNDESTKQECFTFP
jgi:hypothetical protein